MIDWRDPDSRPERHVTAWSASRWGFAVVTIVSMYSAALWLAINWRPTHAADGGAPPAVMIDLAPLEAAPPAPPQETPPGPQMVEAEPVPEPQQEPEPVPEPEPEPQPEPPPEPEPEPTTEPPPKELVVEQPPAPEPEIKIPEPPMIERRDAVVLPAPPSSKVERKPPPRKPPPPQRVRAPQTTAPISAQRQANRATAPNTGVSAASPAATASWRSSLGSHLNRFKRYPPGATRTGVASVTFTIDRSGRVTGSRLVSSSGDAALDAEAVSLPRRASPVPAPPPGFGGGSTITLTVPIRFSR